MNWIVSVAALLQIGEARVLAREMAKLPNAREAVGGHPKHGVRPEPDEMVEATSTSIAPLGQEPSRWFAAGFDGVVDNYMNRPPALLASGGGPGCTVSFLTVTTRRFVRWPVTGRTLDMAMVFFCCNPSQSLPCPNRTGPDWPFLSARPN